MFLCNAIPLASSSNINNCLTSQCFSDYLRIPYVYLFSRDSYFSVFDDKARALIYGCAKIRKPLFI